MRTGPVLVTDLVDKYQPLGAFGQPVYLSYVQLRAAVAQKLGPRHAQYFARPDRDPQNKSIHWIAEVAGTARRWVDLSPDEQALNALELQAMRSDFARYVGELRQQPEPSAAAAGAGGGSGGNTGAGAFASLLEQALLVPDDSHLYFVGDQPVVSFWGFKSFDAAGFDALGVAPRKPATAAAPVAAAAPAAPAVAPVAAVAGEAPRRGWWRWMRWLLLALLLLLLLALLLRACLPDEQLSLLIGEPPPIEKPLQPGEPPQEPRPDEGGFVDRTLRSLGLSETVPGGDATVTPVVPGTDAGTMTSDKGMVPGEPLLPPGAEKPLADEALPPGTEPPGEPPLPPGAEKPLGEEPLPPGTEKPGEPPLPPQPGPSQPEPSKPEPPLGPDGKPQDPAAPPATPPGTSPGAPPGAPPSAPPGGLQIPPNAPRSGAAGFLGGGTWTSDSGLVDQSTGKPLQQSLQFDKQGQGAVTLKRADGTTCQAPAQARMDAGKLRIEETADPRCADGSTIRRSQTECSRTPSGQTVCVGRNPDGTTYRVGIQRQQP